jgi:hypothetical protein
VLSTGRLVLERVLRRCQARVRAGRYAVTLHAADEMEADGYDVSDLEFGILTGSILEAQRDRVTRERKFRIRGSTGRGRDVELVVKFGPSGWLVVITVYEP